jgi:chitinase
MNRSRFLLACLLLLILASPEPETAGVRQAKVDSEVWSLGYWTPWGDPPLPPDRIEWRGLTHVVHAWALVRPNGTLDLSTQRVSPDARRLVSAAHANGVKALLGVGQPYWTGQTRNLPEAASRHRSALVDEIVAVMEAYGFDGVDLDWEPFSPAADGSAMRLLAADLRERLGKRPLSAAAIITDYEYWGKVHGYFDRIGVMTYDMAGTWSPYSWHSAALYHRRESRLSSLWESLTADVWSIDLAVQRFTTAGVPRSKLSIGIPFYGTEWSGSGLTAPRQTWVRKPVLRKVSYQKLEGRIRGEDSRWDDVARVPYLTLPDADNRNASFLSYDDERSIAEKVRYAKSNRLGGWIIWELPGGYFPRKKPTQPLLEAVRLAAGE